MTKLLSTPARPSQRSPLLIYPVTRLPQSPDRLLLQRANRLLRGGAYTAGSPPSSSFPSLPGPIVNGCPTSTKPGSIAGSIRKALPECSLSIPKDLRTKIRRLYFAEHWKVNTIASQLQVHPDTIHNAINREAFSNKGKPRPSALDEYVSFMTQTLKTFPRLPATRLHEMLEDRGYKGSSVQLRRYIKKHGLRPSSSEAFFKLRTLPGEQAQADWGYYGKLSHRNFERRVWLFVIILTWSRAIHVHISFKMDVSAVLRAHVEAFDHFGGVARNILYDNAKTIVIEREGDFIRYQPRFLDMADHYLFSPKPCGVRMPHEKGGVERAIRYLRSSFLAGRTFCDVEDMQEQFHRWREEVAYQRPCPDRPELTVREAWEKERLQLLELPAHPINTDEMRTVTPKKQPYVRHDYNLYSIPHTLVNKPLTLLASDKVIRVVDGDEEVARHERSWEHHKIIEDHKHLEGLKKRKPQAFCLSGRQRLIAAVPQAQELYEELARRGEPMGPQTAALLRLLDLHGPQVMKKAVIEALHRETPRASSVAFLINRERRAQGAPPKIAITLSERPELQEIHITNHNLEEYDELINNPDKD